MICCRIMALLLLLVFTACGVCSCFLPLFRASTDNSTSTIQYWYTQTVNISANNVGISTRHYNGDRVCSVDRMCFTAAAALSTSGAGLGGIAVLLAAMWVYSGRRMCVQHLVTWATFFSFACFAATLGLTVFSYMEGTCTNDVATNTSAIKDLEPKHDMVEGFYLICVATAGMFLSLLYMSFSYCCGDHACCCVVAGDMRLEYDSDSYSRRSSKSHHSSMSRRPSMSRHHSSRRRSGSTLSRHSRSHRSRSSYDY